MNLFSERLFLDIITSDIAGSDRGVVIRASDYNTGGVGVHAADLVSLSVGPRSLSRGSGRRASSSSACKNLTN